MTLAAILLVGILVSIGAAFIYNQSLQKEKTPFMPTATVEPMPSLTPIATSNDSLPADPDAYGGFAYLGNFYIVAPIEGDVCNGSNVNLTVQGEVDATNSSVTLAYSLDGQKQVPINFQLQPVLSHWDPFHSIIDCTVTLKPLSSGVHTITVVGTYQFNSLHEATANVTFTTV